MLVANGFIHPVPGPFRGISFLEDKSLSLEGNPVQLVGGGVRKRDTRPRPHGTWIRGIVVHTRMGLPVKVHPGKGPDIGWDEDLAKRFVKDDRSASCHVAIDADGSYACLADLVRTVTYHAGHVNEFTVSAELYQTADGIVYESTLESAVLVIDALTRVLGIQRQYAREREICRRFATPNLGVSGATRLTHMRGGVRGVDFCGVYGHRNVTRNRGAGDPGDNIFALLKDAGYEGWHVDSDDDLDVWSHRQKALGIEDDQCDGIVGPRTRALLQQRKQWGLWVSRPGDSVAAGA